MTSISGSASATFTYNGLGYRLTQNGVNYTLDLNAGLTQVLDDGTNTYVYGVGRVAQTGGTDTDYFLGDALGSVRQLVNAGGEVTLAKSYTPYGEVMSSAGSRTSPFAFTGEQQDASGLTYLRARYYSSGDGRLLTKDTWAGDAYIPITYNKWTYANANPIFYTDRSGLRPECWNQVSAVIGQICAIERFHEILRENSNNGVNALAALFTDSELQTMGGFYTGTTSATRLEWILKVTLGSNKSLALHLGAIGSCTLPWQWEAKVLGIDDQLPPLAYHFQFAVSFPAGANSGLPNELEDSQFYDGIIWIQQTSQQINHFLTAVSEYYYGGRDLRLIIAHEKSTDPCEGISRKCLTDLGINVTNEVTPADRSHFYKAWHYDTNGMYAQRDAELWAILEFGPNVAFGGVDKERQGNSLQDLRLSLRGVRFADWVMRHRSSPPSEAGQWLTAKLPLP